MVGRGGALESRTLGRIVLGLLWGIGWFYYLLPWPIKKGVASFFGWGVKLLGVRSKVLLQNLDLAFPAQSDAEKKAWIYRSTYQHIGYLFFEIFMLFGPIKKFVQDSTVLNGREKWEAARAQGKGVILLASHVGNWEVMAAVGAYGGGLDVLFVTKRLKPSWFHTAMEDARKRLGILLTYEPRTLRDILNQIKKGGTVGIILDQYAGPPISVRVPVFGTPVGTSNAIATLVKRTGALVLPVVNHRTADGRFIVEIFDAVPWQEDSHPEKELAINTARYSEIVEKWILQYPDQWLWTHRRFKGDLSPLRVGEWEEGRARS